MEKKLLLIAIAAGVLAIVAVQIYISSKENALTQGYRLVEIFTAGSRIEKGDVISPEDNLTKVAIPDRFKPTGAITTEYEALLAGGRVTAQREIDKDSLILYSDIQPEQDRPILHKIDSEHRAMAIPVSQVTSVANLIRPGDRVDILAVLGTAQSGNFFSEGSGTLSVKKVGEDVEILAVGNEMEALDFESQPDYYETVTILVKTEDAEKILLDMAQLESRQGLTLVLRGQEEN